MWASGAMTRISSATVETVTVLSFVLSFVLTSVTFSEDGESVAGVYSVFSV